MTSSAKICSTKDTLFLFFPNNRNYIVTKDEPFFAYIFDSHWIDKSILLNREYLNNYFNGFVSKEDIDAGAGLHIISSKYWLNKIEVGRSFYGLVGFEDCATPSDIIKESIGEKIHITPEGMRLHKVFVLSYPITGILEMADFQHLEKVCLSSKSPWTKSERLLTLLG